MLELTFDAPEARELGEFIEAQHALMMAAIARECEEELRSRRRTRWPQRTGFSRDRWRVDDVAHTDELLATNTATYAKFVNNRRLYPSGRPNPNYQAGQRTVQGAWEAILRRANRRADKAGVGLQRGTS